MPSTITVTNLCASEMTLLIALTAVSVVCAILLLFVILLFASKKFRRGFFRSDYTEPEKPVEPKAVEPAAPAVRSQPTERQAQSIPNKHVPTYVTNSPRRTGERLNSITRPISSDRIRTSDRRTGDRVRTNVPITDSDFDPVLTVPLDFPSGDKLEQSRRTYERVNTNTGTNTRPDRRAAQNMQTRDPVPTVALPPVHPEKGGTYIPRTVPRSAPSRPVTNTAPRRPVRSTDKPEK